METEHFIENQVSKLNQKIGLYEMMDSEITKTTFHFQARKFVNSLIRQREVILNHHAGHKNPCAMYKAIDRIRINLDATGNKNAAMARFFQNHEEEIRSLIPGSYPNKQFEKFVELRDQARQINLQTTI